MAGGRDAGRRWRAEYLKLTYGCGKYRPYETLVREAAEATGLGAKHAAALAARWDELAPWDDVPEFLQKIPDNVRVGVVTNCSEALGRRAAERVYAFDVVMTSERAGYYKPDPAPYRAALEALGVAPKDALFVAGSGYDLFGTGAVGIPTLWHNRAGLAKPESASAPLAERRTLHELLPFLK